MRLWKRWGSRWRAGPFEGQRYGTSLRWLEASGAECVRAIALIVRDREWRTPAADAGSVRARFLATGRGAIRGSTRIGRAALDWKLAVQPIEGGIVAEATLSARGTVTTNRAGLVVLLPTSTCAGARFVARHVDGQISRGRLPREIAPHQPMVALRGLSLALAHGDLDLTLEGDTFEMEDQRNWLDPSFKLYNRPLADPVPYRIRDGVTLTQRVTLRWSPRRRAAAPAAPRWRCGTMPALGLASAPGRLPRRAAELEPLREAAPTFLLHRARPDGRDVGAAARVAAALGAALRVEAIAPGPSMAESLAAATPEAIAIHLAEARVRRDIRERVPNAERVGGTFADFVMLNRQGLESDADAAAFALCPTVHAPDDRSLIETLDALPQVLVQALAIAGPRPLHVGPCALLRRLSPRDGHPTDRPRRSDGTPYDVDPRQAMPIAAAWLATAAALASSAGVASFCAFEAIGGRGLIAREGDFGGRRAGWRTPAHAVLAALAAQKRATVTVHAVDAWRGAAFTLGGATPETWLVDLSGRPTRISPRHPGWRLAEGAQGYGWQRDARRGATISAYGIVRVPSDRSRRDADSIAAAWMRGRP